ncbi:hypothetical protein [Phyllobacterium sp. P30BS-XVII]|uniref:hypothetical protein n=1 Tax=Phyllobacterium sp. P30BS-XVII TaxID=2587046 RepID=UPI0013AF62EA|nr:hypothetical protein [Phyllobacterium sp. P30BS-XVII]MBA8901219.1 hypothetical protein [Phyllobacterium sp. P30BS-XVII]
MKALLTKGYHDPLLLTKSSIALLFFIKEIILPGEGCTTMVRHLMVGTVSVLP